MSNQTGMGGGIDAPRKDSRTALRLCVCYMAIGPAGACTLQAVLRWVEHLKTLHITKTWYDTCSAILASTRQEPCTFLAHIPALSALKSWSSRGPYFALKASLTCLSCKREN